MITKEEIDNWEQLELPLEDTTRTEEEQRMDEREALEKRIAEIFRKASARTPFDEYGHYGENNGPLGHKDGELYDE